MKIETSVDSLRKSLAYERVQGNTVGFVPTMGALHAGHISLVKRAREDCDVVILSIFVNPLQFGVNEDLSRYPRPFEVDCDMAEANGVDYIFAPPVAEMYTHVPMATVVHVAELTDQLEGAQRLGHFDGVATVVTKLFSIVGECRAYFGEKDWQQLAVVSRMTSDLSLSVDIIPCPIIREADGLAMSSRNVYLSSEERKAALSLHRALNVGIHKIDQGCRVPIEVGEAMHNVIAKEPLVMPDYAVVVDSDLQIPQEISGKVRLLIAAKVGATRLIDNIGIEV